MKSYCCLYASDCTIIIFFDNPYAAFVSSGYPSQILSSENVDETISTFLDDICTELTENKAYYEKEGQNHLKHEKLEDGFIFGSVDKVTDQINALRDAGVKNLMFKVNTGQMDYGIIERTISLLGNEVMPRFS